MHCKHSHPMTQDSTPTATCSHERYRLTKSTPVMSNSALCKQQPAPEALLGIDAVMNVSLLGRPMDAKPASFLYPGSTFGLPVQGSGRHHSWPTWGRGQDSKN